MVLRSSNGKLLELPSNSPGWFANVLKCHQTVEVVYFVIFTQLVVNFEAFWENIFKELKLLTIPVKHGHRCDDWLWQLGSSNTFITKNCGIVVVRLLLKGQQILVHFNCRRGTLTAELRLTGKAVLFLLSGRGTRAAVFDFFVNTCHFVVAIPRTIHMCSVTLKGACFRMTITLGVVLISSLHCAVCVLARLRSSLVVALIYQVQNKVVKTG